MGPCYAPLLLGLEGVYPVFTPGDLTGELVSIWISTGMCTFNGELRRLYQALTETTSLLFPGSVNLSAKRRSEVVTAAISKDRGIPVKTDTERSLNCGSMDGTINHALSLPR